MRILWMTFIVYTFLHAQYSLYEECDEYYDSRGFYHNNCKENSFDANKALDALNTITDIIQPKQSDTNKSSDFGTPLKPTLPNPNSKALDEQGGFEFGAQE